MCWLVVSVFGVVVRFMARALGGRVRLGALSSCWLLFGAAVCVFEVRACVVSWLWKWKIRVEECRNKSKTVMENR